MGYKTSATTCRVQLISYRRMSSATTALCDTLRREAGRCWSDMVATHKAARDSQSWLDDAELYTMTKGGAYDLHSQSVQALVEKLLANIAATQEMRRQQRAAGAAMTANYPYKPKPYSTVRWKDQSLRVRDGSIYLPNGRRQQPLVLPLPARFHSAIIRQAELLWRADHYQLSLTIEAAPNPPTLEQGQIAGVDLGIIHAATVATETGHALVINGRKLRHDKQLRNKRHAAYTSRMAHRTAGSRRWRRLKRQKARSSAKLYRQQRNLLHQVARKVVKFAAQQGVRHLAVGDVRGIADGINQGVVANQRIAQWPYGQLVNYLRYKAREVGITLELIPEDYSTRTCSVCGHVRASATRGRVYTCTQPGCGATLHRDANGAANICSRARYGCYGRVQVEQVTHRRATVVRAATPANVAHVSAREKPSA
jgi:putative transposase